jgi:chitodextrinase
MVGMTKGAASSTEAPVADFFPPPDVQTRAGDGEVVPDETAGGEIEPPGTEPHDETSGSRRWWLWMLVVLVGIAAAVGLVIWAPWQPTPVEPPEAVQADLTSATSVELQWEPATEGAVADAYVIVQGDQQVGSVEASETSFTVTGLTPNTAYEFSVVSVDGDRRSEPSNPLAVRTDPGTPTALQADVAAATVRLRWDEPAGPSVDSYVIVHDDDEVGSVDASETSFTVTGLTPNTAYEFSVVSVDGDRRSAPSDPLAVRTAPGTPTALRVDQRQATSLRLVWDEPPGEPVDSYVIVNDGTELATVAHPETSFRVGDLIPGASYDFAVIAETLSGRRSTPAEIVGVTAATPPPGELVLDTDATTTDTIVLTWTPPPNSPTPSEYRIIRNGKQIDTVTGDTLSYTDTGLAPATSYRYRVRADWGYQPSKPTPAAKFTTTEPPVSDARLSGPWAVDLTVVEDPGGNLDVGYQWSDTWQIDSTCKRGPCDATLQGSFSPPGYNYKEFTIDLTRDGATYTGSTTAQTSYCSSVPSDNTLTVQMTVDTARTTAGQWTASSWTGTLEMATPYIDVGDGYYCPSQTYRYDLSATGS